MNLIHKIGLTVLFAACATGLSTDCCCCEQNSRPLPFTLTEFIKAEKAAKAVMLSDLLQSWEFSDDEIAHMLEVNRQDITNARKHFGPLEVDALVNQIDGEYRERCNHQFNNDIVVPLIIKASYGLALVFVGAFAWQFDKLDEENEWLKWQLRKHNIPLPKI